MNPPDARSVLLVEDEEDDVILFKRALKKSGLAVHLSHAEDGRSALEYLAGASGLQDRTRPSKPALVLLDLKLPHRDGHEVLRWARASQALDDVCFVMLTSSAEPVDVDRAYAAGANGYLTKPISPETLSELWTKISAVWPSAGPRVLLNLSKSVPPRPGRPSGAKS